jgi:hypothetical protein
VITKNIKSDPEQVADHISKLDPSIRPTIEFLRKVILKTDKAIGERIKWNNPSFYYTGEMEEFDPKEYRREIIVFNLLKNRIMLVFPSGAKVNDKSGFLTGDFKDGRRLVVFKDLADAKARQKTLQEVIVKWVELVE